MLGLLLILEPPGSVPGVGGVLPDQHGGAVPEGPVAGMKEAIGG
jgi:hypothetical protein